MSNSASTVAQFDGSSRGHSASAYPIARRDGPWQAVIDASGAVSGYRHRKTGRMADRFGGKGFMLRKGERP